MSLVYRLIRTEDEAIKCGHFGENVPEISEI